MKAVSETIEALGDPVFLRSVRGASLAATIARWRHGDARVDVAASDTTLIAVSLRDRHPVAPQPGRSSAGVMVPAGSVLVVPARRPVAVHIVGEADILQIFLSEKTLESVTRARSSAFASLETHRQELQGAAVQILVAATRQRPCDAALLDAGLERMVACLHDPGRRPSEHRRSGLEASAFRRVEDLVTATLEDGALDSLAVARLAGVANQSVDHFIRAFSSRTGVTPHRYVVRRRLQRALALLSGPDVSVSEVADRVGFATPAHFGAAFRRFMGVTPGSVRAALMG